MERYPPPSQRLIRRKFFFQPSTQPYLADGATPRKTKTQFGSDRRVRSRCRSAKPCESTWTASLGGVKLQCHSAAAFEPVTKCGRDGVVRDGLETRAKCAARFWRWSRGGEGRSGALTDGGGWGNGLDDGFAEITGQRQCRGVVWLYPTQARWRLDVCL